MDITHVSQFIALEWLERECVPDFIPDEAVILHTSQTVGQLRQQIKDIKERDPFGLRFLKLC